MCVCVCVCVCACMCTPSYRSLGTMIICAMALTSDRSLGTMVTCAVMFVVQHFQRHEVVCDGPEREEGEQAVLLR